MGRGQWVVTEWLVMTAVDMTRLWGDGVGWMGKEAWWMVDRECWEGWVRTLVGSI